MVSPVIVVPGAKQKAPKLTFQHYMAAETGADGGNVKVSINGGAFAVVPASAYIFNKPTTLLTAAAGNTNPLAGEAGFTGTDGGEVTGSWGESQIDLTMIGVKPGDSIQLRFDFGQDGCTGVDGWYVDDVKVLTCKSKATVAIAPSSVTSTYGQAKRIVVTVSPEDGSITPTGTVTVSEGAADLASGALAPDGTAKLFLPAKLSAGAHSLSVDYSGDTATGSASQPLVARVSQAVSSSSMTLDPNPAARGRTVRAMVTTTSTGFTPSGFVVLTSQGSEIGTGKLSNGKATIRLTKSFAVGTHTIRAKYLGTDDVEPSSTTASLRVIR